MVITKEVLNADNYACVVVKNGELKHAVNGKGIKPLLNLYKEHIEDLEGSNVADKVIGKSAASILICAKVKDVYGKVMSNHALEILNKYNINVEYDTLVEEIHNMINTGMCPMENLVKYINKPEEAVQALIRKIYGEV